MKCRLMHANVTVASVEFDEVTGVFTKIYDAEAPEHLPVGVTMQNGVVNRRELHAWWLARAIPASRLGLTEALQTLNAANTAELSAKSFGLNLSDQYWICPDDAELDWNELNFFENDFSDDIGNILIGLGTESNEINYMSPDLASDGWLKKKWRIVDGKRVLFKSGSGPHYQEPYNEVLASAIMKRLGIYGVEYSLSLVGDKPYCACADFITAETELVTAHNILKSVKKPNNRSVYAHYIECCRQLGITDIEQAVDRMLTLDYIIVNEDRHLNNFGLIRNARSLEYIRPAPIYDSGSSMWYNTNTRNIKAGARETESKPFKKSHSDQIKLVKDLDWLDIGRLNGIDEEFSEILKNSLYIDTARRDTLCKALNTRIKMLENEQNRRAEFLSRANT